MNNDSGLSVPPCLDELSQVSRVHPGIVCVTVPAPGTVEILYDPHQVSRREVCEFVAEAGEAIGSHVARCTMPLQGRACEKCAEHIERRVQNVPGVRHATASFLNGSMSVVFDRKVMTPAELVLTVQQLGAPLVTRAEFLSGWNRVVKNLDSVKWQQRMVVGAGIAIVLGFGLSRMDAVPALAVNLVYAAAYVWGGYSGVRASIRSLQVKTVDVDVLMVLAAVGAAMIGAAAEGALLLFLFSLSNLLQDMAVGKARGAIASLLDLRPALALVKQGDEFVEMPVESVNPGAVMVLRPGERVPMDGEVISGQGSVNQAPVTGESMPVEKSPGDQVFTGTLNQEGSLEVRVTRPASDSTLARMISLVESAQSEKATTQQFLDRAEQDYAGGVIALTIGLAVLPPLLTDVSGAAAFYRAIAVMVVASPCALVLSTPAAILSAIAGLGRRGILVKGGRHLEDGATIRAVAFDKTGTLTSGKPVVTDIVVIGEVHTPESERELLSRIAQAETRSEHPLASAVIGEAEKRQIAIPPVESYSSITGRGGEAVLADGTHILFGSIKLMRERNCVQIEELESRAHVLEQQGKTIVSVAQQQGDQLVALGLLGLQDVLRPQARQAIESLRRMGIDRIVMISGDSPGVANAVAAEAGIKEVYGSLMPEDKVRVIREIASETPVIMVGDGINDAPALAAANLGMAMGAAGTDVAMETADVVLMSHDIGQVPVFLQTSRKSRRVVTQNLTFSVAVVIVLLIGAIGFDLKLSLGVLGHEGSTVLVCLNGLRLLRGVKQP